MNILYLCDEYPPGRHGGIGTVVQTLSREMVKQGNNVVVAGFYDWGYGGEDEFEDEGVKVYRFRRGLSSVFFNKQDSIVTRVLYKLLKSSRVFEWDIKRSLKRYASFLEDLIRKYAIDIIEMPDYNDYMRFCKNVIPFPKLSVPTIVKLHGSLVYFMEEAGQKAPANIWAMEHNRLTQANGVTSVSEYTARNTAKYLAYNKDIKVLYNGIEDIGTFNIQKVAKRVVFSGSLAEKKGIYQLMKAWNIVYALIPDAELYIYGKGPVNKISTTLDAQAMSTVHFKGHVPRNVLLKEIATSQVAVLPSFAESFGLAAIEAMLCGTATIFTDKTSGPEIIDNGKNGLLANPESVKDIADKIILLLRDEKLCSQIAISGKKHVEEKFSISAIAAANLQYYRQTIDKN